MVSFAILFNNVWHIFIHIFFLRPPSKSSMLYFNCNVLRITLIFDVIEVYLFGKQILFDSFDGWVHLN